MLRKLFPADLSDHADLSAVAFAEGDQTGIVFPTYATRFDWPAQKCEVYVCVNLRDLREIMPSITRVNLRDLREAFLCRFGLLQMEAKQTKA